jgi:hypothetical protein
MGIDGSAGFSTARGRAAEASGRPVNGSAPVAHLMVQTTGTTITGE